jgi:hypothetical protein
MISIMVEKMMVFGIASVGVSVSCKVQALFLSSANYLRAPTRTPFPFLLANLRRQQPLSFRDIKHNLRKQQPASR